MGQNQNGRQNKGKSVLAKTRAKTRVAKKRGMKTPGRALERVIKVINLVPKTTQLPEKLPIILNLDTPPTIERIEQQIRLLPAEKLVTFLIDVLHREFADMEAWERLLSIEATYGNIRSYREALYRVIGLIKGGEINYLRECRNCGLIFFAGRKTQWYCEEEACKGAAKEKRQEKWLLEYERKHGHPYKAKKREPRRITKVREALERWEKEERFDPTDENMRILAADADVTLKQCQEAFQVINNAK